MDASLDPLFFKTFIGLSAPYSIRGFGMAKKKFVINEEACRAAGDSEETIKFLKKETRKLKT